MSSLSPMRVALMLLMLLALVLGFLGCVRQQEELGYPQAARGDQSDDFFGNPVADPYRWLEDLDGQQTRQWIEAENELSRPYLEAIEQRQAIADRLTELWNHERYQVPVMEGGRYFFSHNDGLQDQDVLYTTKVLDGERRVLIDPNTFSDDGTVSLATFSVSPDGRHVAYAVSDGGSDWKTWKVRNTESGEDLPETLAFIKFTPVSWTRDGGSFYYSRYPELLGEPGNGDGSAAVAVYRHRIGTPQDDDILVYSIPDHPQRNPYARVSDDGRYLIISIQEGYLENAVHVRDLAGSGETWIRLLDRWDALYEYLGNDGSTFYFQTNHSAPRNRVIAIELDRPQPENWREVIPHGESKLEETSYVGGRLVARYLEDVKSRVLVYDPAGVLVDEVELPGIGSADGFEGRSSQTETFYSFTSFTVPPSIYRYDVAERQSTLIWQPEAGIESESFTTEQVFYSSKDGTQVPMFLTHRKDLQRAGNNPTLLYGYGGFNVSLTPRFSVANVVWLQMGGVLAIPNLRGGGEYGREWHMAGARLNKQNVFDDFIAAAEWLIAEGYTSTPRLAISGASNGGLLVAAALTQRPDLFGAVLPDVGVLDMLRYHLPSANARNWATDYGLSENEEDFRAQIAYSPLHNVRRGQCYPPTLITTADHDDRVVPWHSFKFGAELQYAQGCDNPILVSIETRAGHGAGTPTWMKIENMADQWAFLVRHLHMKTSVSPD